LGRLGRILPAVAGRRFGRGLPQGDRELQLRLLGRSAATPAFPTFDLITFAQRQRRSRCRASSSAYQQQLRLLPAPLDGLGFMANADALPTARPTYPTAPRREAAVHRPERPDRQRGAHLRKAQASSPASPSTGATAHLREDEPIGATTDEDRYIDDFYQLDLSANYRFARNWEVFGEVINLTNQPFRVYFNSSNGQGRRFVQFEEYDVTVNVGLRWKL
jgi:outer membrane receptor protein involved in Fe transport